MTVRSSDFQFSAISCQTLSVNNNRRSSFNFQSFFILYSSFYNFQMQFSHTRNQVFSSLFIYLYLNARIFFSYSSQNFNQLRQISRFCNFNRFSYYWLEDVFYFLKWRLFIYSYRIPNICVNSNYCKNISSRNFLHLLWLYSIVNKNLLQS